MTVAMLRSVPQSGKSGKPLHQMLASSCWQPHFKIGFAQPTPLVWKLNLPSYWYSLIFPTLALTVFCGCDGFISARGVVILDPRAKQSSIKAITESELPTVAKKGIATCDRTEFRISRTIGELTNAESLEKIFPRGGPLQENHVISFASTVGVSSGPYYVHMRIIIGGKVHSVGIFQCYSAKETFFVAIIPP